MLLFQYVNVIICKNDTGYEGGGDDNFLGQALSHITNKLTAHITSLVKMLLNSRLF